MGPVVVCEQFGVAPPRGNRPQRSFRVATGQMILQFRLESHFRSPMHRAFVQYAAGRGRLWEQSAADVRGTALGGKAKAAARFVEIARNGAQGLEEAEGHIPGPAGKNGKDRGKLGPQRPVRRQGNEEHRGEGEIAQQRHGLEHIEERDQHHLRAAAVRRQHAVSEGEDERHAERQHHPQGCA